MVVQMRCGCGACDEWAMVELQGEVRLQVEDSGTQPHELDLGEFCADQGSGKAAFTIGYHRLQGKEEKLKRPLAILEAAPDDGAQGARVLQVVGVIRRKFIFRDRPRALITPRDAATLRTKKKPGADFFAAARKKAKADSLQ